MFTYQTTIRMHHTDATGAVYYPRYFQIATECLETFLDQKGWPGLKDGVHTPVVHAECDCKRPLILGTPVSITLTTVKLGNTSFTMESVFKTGSGDVAATVKVVHVTVDKGTGRPVVLPEGLCAWLGTILLR